MFHLLDASLEAFLRSEVPLPTRDVDVAFDAPDSDWSSRVSKPTVNLFLWDVRRNTVERESGMRTVESDGQVQRRPQVPRVDCRYLVTAWTTVIQDEHSLLGSVLNTFLLHGYLPENFLDGELADMHPLPTIKVASADGKNQSDFWSALGGQLKPGLDLKVTATFDAAVIAEAGPPVFAYRIDLADKETKDSTSSRHLIGGHADAERGTTVRSHRGTAEVGEDGRFTIRAEPGDEVVVESEKVVSAEVPESGEFRIASKKTTKKS